MTTTSTEPQQSPIESDHPKPALVSHGGWWAKVQRFEDWAAVGLFAVMVLLPLAEALLRRLFHTGIASSATLVQHSCLVLGMLGGALAAREQRLLSLSTVTTFLSGRAKSAAKLFSHGVATAITIALCLAATRFVQEERASGAILAYGIGRWVVQAAMPIGFGLIAARLTWHSAENWKGRALTLLLAGSLVAIATWPPLAATQLRWPALLLISAAAVLGAPIFVVLGGAAVVLFWAKAQPLEVLPIDHYGLVVNATLPTIPLFTLAGYFLAEGGASQRLVRVCNGWVGHFRGGAAIATALACAFFTSFTGASGVTILALGALLLPVLVAAGYSERNALGLLTGAGSLGLLFPPCLPLVLYAIVAKVPIEQIFLGGILPGLLLVLLTAVLGMLQGPSRKQIHQFSWAEARAATWEAKWELLLPVVALVGLFGGFCTPLEAAALTAAYAFCIEALVYRDLKVVQQTPHVIAECALLVGGVLLILGVALGFTDYLIDSEAPDHLLAWVQSSIHSRWLFLLILNVFLLVVGCLVDIFSAIIVVVPLIIPLGNAFGIHPVHLGIIFLANLELGFLTPPVGMNLFLASYRFGKPMPTVIRSVIPILLVLLFGVILITYFPPLTTFLPNWLK